jgi:hypothetical protein
MRIKFLVNRDVVAQDVVVQSYKAGEIYEMEVPSARRWIRRQLAVEVQGAVTPPKKKRGRPKKQRATAKAGGKTGSVKLLDDTAPAPGRDDSDSGLGAVADAGAGGSLPESGNTGDQ